MYTTLSRRIRSSVMQEARRIGSTATGEAVLTVLPGLLDACGPATANRKVLQRIARALLHSKLAPRILAPCCPDYTHDDERYTFEGLGDGISLLTEKHLAFMPRITALLPQATVLILIADQEADDEELCKACGHSQEAFRAQVSASIRTTRAAVADRGWRVEAFTEAFPSIREDEPELIRTLLEDRSIRNRLTTETISRSAMYRRIRPGMTPEEMLRRTARTAAQYLLIGRIAAARHMLLVNHTTTNLGWYADADAAILHNPISVY